MIVATMVFAGAMFFFMLLHIGRTVDALSKQIWEIGEDLRKLTHPELPHDY